jgi:hypothetical protein
MKDSIYEVIILRVSGNAKWLYELLATHVDWCRAIDFDDALWMASGRSRIGEGSVSNRPGRFACVRILLATDAASELDLQNFCSKLDSL